ncbi:hypothetical protein [Methanogenium cariaci]|jgi:hypothetical protein
MRVIILEDCSADDLSAVLRPVAHGRLLSDLMSAAHNDCILGDQPECMDCGKCDEVLTEEVVRNRKKTALAELARDISVGHSRSWKTVEDDIVAQCSSWSQAIENYREAYPRSPRTDAAIKGRWYGLKRQGVRVAQEVEPEVSAQEEISEPENGEEIPVDRQPEADAAEVTTLCEPIIPADAPEPPTDAQDVENEDVQRALIGARCQADVPSERGGSTYVREHILRVLADRQVLIECDSGGWCWCTLDCVALLEER